MPVRLLSRIGWLLLLATLAPGCTGPAPPSPVPGYRLIDLMPRYWAFRDSTADTPVSERPAAFRRIVLAAEPRFYAQVFPVPDDARLGGYLAMLEPIDPVVRRVADETRDAIPVAMARLRQVVPALGSGARIYLVPSLFNSNGQVRYLDDSLVVMLGPDVQAYVEVHIDSGRRADPIPTIVHELAHWHHWRTNPEIGRAAATFFKPGSYAPLYYNLWSEGLATYVARIANPEVALADVLGPGVRPAEGPQLLPRLAAEFLGRLESTAEDDVRDLFYLSGRRTDLPLRSAYYVGYRVVERLARERSLAELLRLDGRELREGMRAALTALAAGQP